MSALPTTLPDALSAFGASAFLVTVSSEARPHLAPVDVALEADGTGAGEGLAVAVLSGARSTRNATANPIICLHWPPVSGTDGYSLIVDGESAPEVREHDTVLHVRPVKAVLHRPGDPEPGTTACGHDCRGITLRDRT